ncbi:MAG: histidine phosphatase family protein [Pirellulaceae bacterium]|nr:histidine phosphatase family protein [Pirellulaceae bacterium]
MKQLLIMRHAKSSWAEGGISDHDRPLNPRGQANAPLMGRFTTEQGCLPDVILSSTANRAISTAELFVEGSGKDIPIRQRRGLYHPSIADYDEAIGCLTEDPQRVMVVSHNPGSEEWIYRLTQQYETIPTATIAVLGFSESFSWSKIAEEAPAELMAVWRPKEVL